MRVACRSACIVSRAPAPFHADDVHAIDAGGVTADERDGTMSRRMRSAPDHDALPMRVNRWTAAWPPRTWNRPPRNGRRAPCVREADAVADDAVVCDMAPRHEEAAIAHDRDAARNGADMIVTPSADRNWRRS